MGVWPPVISLTAKLPTICSFLGAQSPVAGAGAAAVDSIGTFVTPNRAYYIPIRIGWIFTVRKMFWLNGSAVAGNVDVGIYDRVGVRLVSSGSTAQSGIDALQEVDITDTQLGPGLFYLAFVPSSSSGAFHVASSYLAAEGRELGILQQDSALPLPATAAFAASTDTVFPVVGMCSRTVI